MTMHSLFGVKTIHQYMNCLLGVSRGLAIECDKLHFTLYLPATTDLLLLILKKLKSSKTSAWSLYIYNNNQKSCPLELISIMTPECLHVKDESQKFILI